NWTENGIIASSNATYTFSVTANRTLVANFTTSSVSCKTPPEYDEELTAPTNSWQNRSVNLQPNGCKIYRVSVTSGRKYAFHTDPQGTVSFNAKLFLYNSSGTLLESSATVPGGSEQLTYSFNFSGNVYVKVNGNSSNTGNFWFSYLQMSNDATLSSLSIDGYALSPNFSANTTNYTVTVPYSVTSRTISATANHSGATVVGTGSKSLNVGSNSFSITVTAEDNSYTKTYNVTIIREAGVTSYVVNVSANPPAGGSVSGGGTYTSGNSCTVKATANNGYIFTNWTENGIIASSNATYTFSVTANRTLVANFKPNTYTITTTVSPESYGSISPNGIVEVASGSNKTFTFTANRNYEVRLVLVNEIPDEKAKTDGYYTFSNITANHTITVYFQKITAIEEVTAHPITLYPNPAQDEIFIQSDVSIERVDILDLSGRPVETLRATSLPNSVQTINVSALPKGVYLVKIHADNEAIMKKIVKK
ncbi:MAG: T9SS type A sorting domain-containing protein, partial [Dysgonamonadaceae bacterium]|nr:T9SS type A sorting domain-containing protein [Dysgonamonadaceae bacterium]